MGFSLLMALTSPVTWLLVAAAVSVWRRSRARKAEAQRDGAAASPPHAPVRRKRMGVMRGAALDAAAAFLFLSATYRPNHAFLMKAQIRQAEDADEDDQGGPETPVRHLQRQLRRIRRGEPVKRLVWRLE